MVGLVDLPVPADRARGPPQVGQNHGVNEESRASFGDHVLILNTLGHRAGRICRTGWHLLGLHDAIGHISSCDRRSDGGPRTQRAFRGRSGQCLVRSTSCGVRGPCSWQSRQRGDTQSFANFGFPTARPLHRSGLRFRRRYASQAKHFSLVVPACCSVFQCPLHNTTQPAILPA